jgi:rhamnogalacturonan endolyase
LYGQRNWLAPLEFERKSAPRSRTAQGPRAAAPFAGEAEGATPMKRTVEFQTLLLGSIAVACGEGDASRGPQVTNFAELAPASNQPYTIVGVHSNKCLEIAGGSGADLAAVQIATCNGSTRQTFTFESKGGGYYGIRNVNSGRCLDVEGASTSTGARIIQYTCGAGQNQQFLATDVSATVHQFVARHSGQALDVNARGTSDGTPLIQWTLNTGATNQHFRVNAAGSGGSGGAGGSGGSGAGGSGGSGAGGSGGSGGSSGSAGTGGTAPTGRFQMEDLNRGVVAVPASGGVYVGWRLFGYEPPTIGFNVYRNGTKVNSMPITSSTNLVDSGGSSSSEYHVRAVVNGVEQAPSETARPWSQGYLPIAMQVPPGGSTPEGSYSYTAGDASVGDVDGDGRHELFVKWDPSNQKDNSQSGYTGNVYIDAYTLSGTRLWRIDLGRNIRAGAHYTQFFVYDLDGDGKAELVCKTAPGTRDGTGQNVLLPGDSATADYRNSSGYVLSGPEYLTVFNGQTGAAMATVPFQIARGTVSAWGDNYGNRVDRFLGTIAFVESSGRPSVIMARGYYTRTTLTAWNWRNGQLTRIWTADSNNSTAYTGQGAHSLSVANVDADPEQEIIYGASTIDNNGTRKCSTGLGHGDALHVSDFLPSRPGLEVFMPHEAGNSVGASLRDANTCQVLWQMSGNGGVEGPGRGVMADVLPSNPGAEGWVNNAGLFAASSSGTQTANLTVVGARPSSANFLIWWDADLSRELLNGNAVGQYDGQGAPFSASGCTAINGTKSTPNLSGDLIGDWREEVIFRCGNDLRLYTTTTPANQRIYTLLHDPQYRVAITWQNVAYNQPPHPSFFVGTGMSAPPAPDIHVR